MTAVNVHNLWFRYSADWVLQDVSFIVKEGEFLGIIGPNGSGKTTLLKIIAGILVPEDGYVTIGNVDIERMKRRDIARIISVVPQESQYMFPFTAGEIVMMGRSPHLDLLALEGAHDCEIVAGAMSVTGTRPLAARNFDELSGGERQRIIIARALAQEPRIMLLDEPMTHLDLRHQIEIAALVCSLTRERKLTVLAVTHDINLASLFCDRLLLLDQGKIGAQGTPREVVTEEMVGAVYGVDVAVEADTATGRPRVIMKRITAC